MAWYLMDAYKTIECVNHNDLRAKYDNIGILAQELLIYIIKQQQKTKKRNKMKDWNDITDEQAMKVVIGLHLIFIAGCVWYRVYCIIFGG